MGKDKKQQRGTKRRPVVVFDPEARSDYITGFRKRKDARRKEAQDAIAARVQAENKELDDKKRSMMRAFEALTAEIAASAIPEDDKQVSSHQDAFTAQAFGHGTVVVTTAVGLHSLDDEDDEAAVPSADDGSGQEETEEEAEAEEEAAVSPAPTPSAGHSGRESGRGKPVQLGKVLRARHRR